MFIDVESTSDHAQNSPKHHLAVRANAGRGHHENFHMIVGNQTLVRDSRRRTYSRPDGPVI